jgi:hypothetical protein
MSQLILQREKCVESDGCSDILNGVIIAIFIQINNDNFVGFLGFHSSAYEEFMFWDVIPCSLLEGE